MALTLTSSVDEVSLAVRTLADAIKNQVSRNDLPRIELGLEELLHNALEHGNLGITHDEKSKALAKDQWQQLLEQRRALAGNANKRISVSLSIENRILKCSIQDEGKGFDWKKVMASHPEMLKLHGRGLFFARHIFDRISFNEQGNQVVVEKDLTLQCK